MLSILKNKDRRLSEWNLSSWIFDRLLLAPSHKDPYPPLETIYAGEEDAVILAVLCCQQEQCSLVTMTLYGNFDVVAVVLLQ